ncbi:MAG TPA: glycosyltransferase [Acidimicrobiales bacterium]
MDDPTADPPPGGGSGNPPPGAAGADSGDAPPVVAVMVVHEPGPWFDEVLDSIDRQDYPNLRLLFLVTGAQPGVMAHIGQRLPGSLMRALGDNPGFGPAANQAMRLVEGAGFFCFLHDDVALDPSTISELVAETYRSNAGIVGPKLVDWDRPSVLQHVGLSADRVGVALDAVEVGELDQEQHDAVRDVFCVPTACLLVRIDLFRALGGFASDIDFYGDDLDLCWRAHLSGARVLVVPDARVRHRQRLPERRPDLDVLALSERHRLRTALSAPTWFHLVGLSVFHLLYTVTGAVVGLFTGRASQVRAMLGAWLWQLVRLPALFSRHRRFQSTRQVSDAEVASLQGVRGSGRLRGYRRQRTADREGRADRLAELGGDLRQQLGGEDARANVVVWVLALAVLIVGSRELILHGVPQAGELLAWPAGPFVLAREYLGGWWSQGLGGTRPVPTGMGLSAALGLVTFGANGLPRTLLVVGPLFAGAFGLWRFARAIAPSRAAAAALAIYIAAPLAANSVGTGSLSGLLAYGALPWTLHGLARLHAPAPFVTSADPRRARRLRWADVVVLGLLAAVVGAFVPVYPIVMVGAAVALAVGSLIVGERAGSGRMLLGSLLAAVIALVLNLPWVLGVLPSAAPAWAVLGVAPRVASHRGLANLAAFDIGPHRLAGLALGLTVPLIAALLAARSYRFAWAGRATILGAAGLTAAWLVDRGTVDAGPNLIPVLLTPYAAALAIGAACFVAAFAEDVRGTTFSWRQLLGVVALVAVVIGIIPLLPAMVSGRWELHNDERAALLSLLPAPPADARSRVLWIGAPEDVPVPGWPLEDGLVYALADDEAATMRERWREEPTRAERLVAEDIGLAAGSATDRLGRLLGPMGVRFVLVPVADAPGGTGTSSAGGADAAAPVRPALLDSLDRQLDLRRVELGDESLVAYENTAWLPVRAAASGGAAAASRQAGPEALIRSDFTGAVPALPGPLPTAGAGPVQGETVLLSEAIDGRWELTVDGQVLPRRTAFGWATAWDLPAGLAAGGAAGQGALRYRTAATRYALVLAQLFLAVLALILIRTWRHGAPFSRWMARRRVAAIPASTVIDLTADPPAQPLLKQTDRSS